MLFPQDNSNDLSKVMTYFNFVSTSLFLYMTTVDLNSHNQHFKELTMTKENLLPGLGRCIAIRNFALKLKFDKGKGVSSIVGP